MRLSSVVMALRSVFLCLAFGAPCAAQTSAGTAGQMPLIPPGRECPVSLNAEPRAYGHTMLADENNAVVRSLPEIALAPPVDPRAAKGDRTGLRVTLRVPGAVDAIRSAEVVVHAVPRAAAATPAAATARTAEAAMGRRATISRSFHLQAAGHPKETLSGMLWMSGVAGVESVTIDAVEYGSGRAWHASERAICRTAPSLYLPVEK